MAIARCSNPACGKPIAGLEESYLAKGEKATHFECIAPADANLDDAELDALRARGGDGEAKRRLAARGGTDRTAKKAGMTSSTGGVYDGSGNDAA